LRFIKYFLSKAGTLIRPVRMKLTRVNVNLKRGRMLFAVLIHRLSDGLRQPSRQQVGRFIPPDNIAPFILLLWRADYR